MTLLYQPISRTFGQRDGCLTPSNQDETMKFKNDKATLGSSRNHEILSPPASPYQKHENTYTVSPAPATSTLGCVPRALKVYMDNERPFTLENYKSYTLTVSPWTQLGGNYKARQMNFLRQYQAVSKEQQNVQLLRLAEKRAAAAVSNKRKRPEPKRSSSESESENDKEKVRTRRVVREHLAALSEIDMDASRPPSPSPKRRKVKKETSYASSPLAAQQAALIDESIPDYSPDPEVTLPKGNNRALKIEWKGQPMDLKNDPQADKLHPAEVVLALTLRLPANVYLDSKRRLFFEKVNRMRGDMPFRRTDAQKACRIDVNKASRLFAAFEKVGWLDDKNFVKFL
ncbi:hypothetical protein C7M61_004571 [Candidozyma pseudohaemuli]|uniref:SWIRM domain-containing protein n=1 Tax=Candidozyma pseudohaemuli TaxID=418784 RepID=A0A2P7YH82_9ASCO|nr:hypothetical protein C7M61_004571 [[Candida] pseudohaemulonii]PSK35326.1 hypothetical protein C7M61_004571 [[Candida] pseudohaemulonii]